MRRTVPYLGVLLVVALAAGVAIALAHSDTGARRLLGDAAHGTHRSRIPRHRVEGTRLTAHRSGSVSSIHVYVRGARRRSRLVVGLYSDRHGRPAHRLTEGVLMRPRAHAWNVISVGRAAIRRGHHYWFAALARGGGVSLAGARACAPAALPVRNALPVHWTARRPANCPLSLYGASAPAASTTSTSTTTPAVSTTTTTPTVSTTSTSPVASQTTGCFSSPGACGYPDPAYGNVGVADCSALKTFQLSDLPSRDYYYSGSGNVIDLYANNATVEGYNISGWEFNISGATGTVFNNDCLSTSGKGGSESVIYDTNNGKTTGSHTTVENSTIAAPGCGVAQAASSTCSGAGINATDVAGGDGTVVDNDILVGAIENVNGLGAGSVVENSYIVANAYEASAHSEDIYAGTGSTNLRVDHNTLLNPFDETAEVFIDNGVGPCQSNGISVTDNLMAGGGFMIYACSGATTLGSNTFTFQDNDLARCEGKPAYDPRTGGQQCGPTRVSGVPGAAYGAGGDSHGFWPGGGYFGRDDNVFCRAPGTTWSGNTWDDDGRVINCR